MSVSVHDVAAFVLQRLGRMEAMKLQKLVYYSQAWHVALTDEPLFEDSIQAWSRGPVVDELWQRHRGRWNINGWDRGQSDHLVGTSENVVALVCDVYGSLSGDDLSELTHQELPWREARFGLADGVHSREPIKLDVMKHFYRRRELAGRSVADLVAGGIAGFIDPTISGSDRRAMLAAVRSEFKGDPDFGPGVPAPVGNGFRTDCDHFGEPEVRVNRDRPARRHVG